MFSILSIPKIQRTKQEDFSDLIYEDLKLVLLVATSGKKDQQETIDSIKDSLRDFRKIAEEISKQVS